MDTGRTLEQQRAAYALDAVDKVRQQAPKSAGDYATLSASFPTLVLASGLGQALAFLMTKRSKEPAHDLLLRHLDGWMCRENKHSPYSGTKEDDLLRAVVAGTQDQYAVAQAEVLALLGWIKRCARAYLETGAQGAA